MIHTGTNDFRLRPPLVHTENWVLIGSNAKMGFSITIPFCIFEQREYNWFKLVFDVKSKVQNEIQFIHFVFRSEQYTRCLLQRAVALFSSHLSYSSHGSASFLQILTGYN